MKMAATDRQGAEANIAVMLAEIDSDFLKTASRGRPSRPLVAVPPRKNAAKGPSAPPLANRRQCRE